MKRWKPELRKKNFRIELVLSVFLLILILYFLSRFLLFVETREGVVLADPLLSLFSPVNLTWFTFVLIYISIFTALINFVRKPEQIMLTVQSYIMMVLIRIIAMYLAPLNPPEGMIPLNDPVVEFFGTGQLLTKDLFFSGHTATLFLFFLISEKKILNYFFLICTILVGMSVILQKVHYSVDVFTAPFFTYAAFVIIKIIRKKLLVST